MAIGDDFQVQSNGNIRHTSGTSTYTVLELHRWLQDLADSTAFTSDDTMDITFDNPSDRATDQIITLNTPYNIDDTAAQYLYGGSIEQNDGTVGTKYSGLQVLGSVANPSTQLEIIQGETNLTNYWGTGLNNSGNILLRILVKSIEDDELLNSGKVRVQAREWGDTYDYFETTLGDGEAVAAINTTTDPQNDSDATAVASYNVTKTEGFQTIDVSNGNGAKPYYIKWDADSTDDLKDLYEWTKYVQRRGTVETVMGQEGDAFLGITHSYSFDTTTGAFTETNVMDWDNGTQLGEGRILAVDTTNKIMYFQMLDVTGGLPINNQVITDQNTGNTHQINGTVTVHNAPKNMLGSFTGALTGAFGAGVDLSDLSAADSIQDLNGTAQSPPNFVDTSVTVKNESGTNIQNARVLVWVTNGDNYFYQTAISITSSGTTATVTHASHGMSTGDYVIISGATEVEYNGTFQVTVTGGSAYTYTLPNSTTSPATGTPVATFAVISGLTNASGYIEDNRVWSSDQAISGWVRKSDSSPFYSQGNITGTIDSGTGLSANIQLVGDE